MNGEIKQPVIEVKNLKKYFKVKNKGMLHAVDGVSFSVRPGETLGLVGESGCGKSTVGNVIMRLHQATDGQVLFKGTNILTSRGKESMEFRKKIQIIFQDPYSSLNPKKTISGIMEEAYKIHHLCLGAEMKKQIAHLIELCGLEPYVLEKYPHELDGGKRQLVGIARALSLGPEFIVCDEPISALDVSIQAQVINILEELQERFGFTYLFISHDLSMVRHISHQVGVMYLGNLIEYAQVDELFDHMLHPYTRSLISAVPVADHIQAREGSRIVLQGDVPSPLDPPAGCPFKARCSFAREICGQEKPVLKNVGGGHMVACHLYDTSVKRS